LHIGRLRLAVPLAAAAVVGIWLRVYIYRSALGVPNSDEAVVGLMARHILHGNFTTFYWGQSYGGPQEAILTAPLVGIFGDSWLALRIVPILLSGAAALLLWRVARRLSGEPAGVFTGALFWVWPPYMIYETTHQLGFYGSDVFYCALLILLALRVVERPDRLRVGLFGLVIGLAFWQTEQIVPVAIPLVVWTVSRQPRALRHLWIAVPLALLGAAPWLAYNLQHHWSSFSPASTGSSTYFHRLRVYVSPLLLMAVGLRTPFSAEPIYGSQHFIDVVWLGVFALACFGAWKARHSHALLPYLLFCAYPFIYAISPLTLDSREPRYLLVLMPVLALIVGQLAATYWRGVAVLAVGAMLSVVILHQDDRFSRRYGTEAPVAPRNLTPLVTALDRLDLSHVYANYWVSYALAYDTKERIVAAQSKLSKVRFVRGEAVGAHDPFARWPEYERQVDAAPRRGFVFFTRGIESIPIVPVLERAGYARTRVGGFVILSPPAK
jgi:4-amino-4-deoxy-L-arabinose transferase-like glycosyltransferase